MKNPKARPILERLIKWADVLTENFKVSEWVGDWEQRARLSLASSPLACV